MTPAGPGTSRATPFVVYFDGASRGNPGPSAYGVWSPSGPEAKGVVGRTTNNVAEWRGFLAALDLAAAQGAQHVEVRADSQLVVLQFLGRYKVKAPHLAPYLESAREKARLFRSLAVVHVPRAENSRADALANAALDGAREERRP